MYLWFYFILRNSFIVITHLLHFTKISVHGGLGIKQNKALITSTKTIRHHINFKSIVLEFS